MDSSPRPSHSSTSSGQGMGRGCLLAGVMAGFERPIRLHPFSSLSSLMSLTTGRAFLPLRRLDAGHDQPDSNQKAAEQEQRRDLLAEEQRAEDCPHDGLGEEGEGSGGGGQFGEGVVPQEHGDGGGNDAEEEDAADHAGGDRADSLRADFQRAEEKAGGDSARQHDHARSQQVVSLPRNFPHQDGVQRPRQGGGEQRKVAPEKTGGGSHCAWINHRDHACR